MTRSTRLSELLQGSQLEPVAARHGRPVFKTTAVAMYNEQETERAWSVFEACREAQARGNPVWVQVPCQPLSFDFSMENAYPFHSHDAFSEIKAHSPRQLKEVFGMTLDELCVVQIEQMLAGAHARHAQPVGNGHGGLRAAALEHVENPVFAGFWHGLSFYVF